jgi:hypothetical protein
MGVSSFAWAVNIRVNNFGSQHVYVSPNIGGGQDDNGMAVAPNTGDTGIVTLNRQFGPQIAFWSPQPLNIWVFVLGYFS